MTARNVAEDLVPRGLPQGERANAIEAQQLAGLPTESGQLDPAGGPALPPPPAAPMGPTAQRVGGFDALLSKPPARPLGPAPDTTDPVADFRARAAISPNSFVREIALLLPDYLE